MAFSAGEIEAILKLRDQMSKQLKTASGSLTKFGQGLSRVGPMAAQAGIGLTAGLTVPIIAVGAAAVTSFAKFEKEMNRVRAISGAAGKDFESLEDKAKELGATTVFSASQSAEAMSSFALAGFEVNEILEVMEGTLDLAAAATLAVGEAASITAKVLRGYGLDTDQTARVTDVLTKAFTTSNTDLTSLGNAFKFVGPIARSAGVEFEETAAALSLMADAGFQGTLGGTALRGAIARLLAPTSKAAGIMKEMGLNVTDATGRLIPLDQIIQQLEPHAEDTGKLMELFGLRAGPAMAALINQGSDALRAQTAALKDAGGTAKQIADVQLKGLAGAFVLFKSAAEGAFISIGEQMAPALLTLLDAVTRFAKFVQNTLVPAFTVLPKSVQVAAVAFVAFLAALGPLLLIFGTLASSLGGLLTLFGTVAGALGGMTFSFVALGAALLPVASAIAVVGAAFAAFKFLKWIGFTDLLADNIEILASKLMGVSTASRLATQEAVSFQEGLGTTLTTAERLAAQLGGAGLIGTMSELEGTMIGLANAGMLDTAAMKTLADRAVELEKGGQELTAGLARVVAEMDRQGLAAGKAAASLIIEEEAAAQAAQAAEELAKQTKEVEAAMKGFGFTTVPEVNKELALLAQVEKLAADRGIDAQASAVLLQGAYEDLATKARASGLEVEGLNAAVEANAAAATIAFPVIKQLSFEHGILAGRSLQTVAETEGITAEFLANIQAAGDLAGAYDTLGLTTQASLTMTREAAEQAFQIISTSADATKQDVARASMALADAVEAETGRAATSGSLAFRLLAESVQGSFAQMLSGSKSFADGFKDIWNSLKASFLGGLTEMLGGFLGNFLPGMSSGFSSLSGTASGALTGGGGVTGIFSGVFGGGGSLAGIMGTMGPLLGGIMTGGLALLAPLALKALAPLGKAVLGGLKKIGGAFKKIFSFGGPGEAELGGREVSAQFNEWAKNARTAANEVEIARLVSEGWAEDLASQVVVVVAQYAELGIGAEEAKNDVKATWDAIKQGPEAVAAAVAVIEEKLAGVGTAAMETTAVTTEAFTSAAATIAGVTTPSVQELMQAMIDAKERGVEASAVFEERFGVSVPEALAAAGEAVAEVQAAIVATGETTLESGELMKQSIVAVGESMREVGKVTSEQSALMAESSQKATDTFVEGTGRIEEGLGLVATSSGIVLEGIELLRRGAEGEFGQVQEVIGETTGLSEELLASIRTLAAQEVNIPVRFDVGSLDLPDVGGGFSIPSLQEGGTVRRTGIARLEAGETVIPAGGGGGGGGDTNINISVTTLDADSFEGVVDRKIIPMLVKSLRGNRAQSRTDMRDALNVVEEKS